MSTAARRLGGDQAPWQKTVAEKNARKSIVIEENALHPQLHSRFIFMAPVCVIGETVRQASMQQMIVRAVLLLDAAAVFHNCRRGVRWGAPGYSIGVVQIPLFVRTMKPREVVPLDGS